MTAIAFIGGTGPLGRGLGLRLSLAGHDVILGSRSEQRAADAAAQLGVPARGADNQSACQQAEIVFITVPFEGQAEVIAGLADALAGKVVVSTVVPMGFDARGPHPLLVQDGSAAEQVQALAPQSTVVSGFQWVPAPKLLKADVVVEMDVPLLGDDEAAVEQVAVLARDVKALNAFMAGPLRLSHSVEGLTPLLLSVNKRYKAHTGVTFAGLPR
jgi:NADPH-dependent F420 reductase